jgi:lysozyme family protein
VGDDWRKRYHGWSRQGSVAHPDSPDGGTGPGFSRPPGYLGDGPSLSRSPVPHPDSPEGRHSSWSNQLQRIGKESKDPPRGPATEGRVTIPTVINPDEISSAEIRSIQQELKQAGYDPGPVDGRWGPRTKFAYDNFLTGARGHVVAPSQGERILSTTSYHGLRPEYERLFANCKILEENLTDVRALVVRLLGGRPRYEAVGKPLGTPWWMIGVLHAMESDLDFSAHLHNGDPLTQRTVGVPSGYPKEGNPPFAWEYSATDALKLHGFHVWRDWSVTGALYKAEEYNGWGVRRYHAASGPTAYLWSLTNQYQGGKYVQDHIWSSETKSRQPGVAAMLRLMVDRGLIARQ